MAPSDIFQKETNINFHFFFQKDLNLRLQHSRNR